MIENPVNKFNYSMSDDAILGLLGAQLKQMRLNSNLTQQQLSGMSGLSRSTISEIENKGWGTMTSFVQILRALQKLELFNYFSTEALVSPIQIAKLKGKVRKRASGVVNKSQEESEW
jgi:transcriptional regulator with XRE-family HTH domain